MFLKKLYRHNKWLFLLMILFSAGQLFINFKRGMVLSPFYHYGMYSEVIKTAPLYGVYEVKVDKKLLQGRDFSAQQWDKIILPIKYFHSIDSMNKLYYKDVKRLMFMLHIRTNDSKFTSPCDAVTFRQQYKGYLSNILDKTIDSVNVMYRNYVFTGKKLKPTEQVYLPEQLCN